MNEPDAQSNDICDAIDGVRIADLIAEHGSPLFVFSEATLRQSYRAAYTAFATRYPDVQFAWSYKTNYLKAVCAVFHREGAIAEVVSDFEYDKARGMGIPGQDIIFNGPYKQQAALERAVIEGAKIQIDHFDELAALDAIAEARGQTVNVAIRIHADTGIGSVWTKFGFNADSSEAIQAIERIRATRYLRLVGLHCHIGTYILKPSAYTRATEKLLDLAEVVRRDYRFEVEYLNLGGGFAPQSQQQVPSFDDYAEAIAKPIRSRWPSGIKLPHLYLESGRALVDDAGYLITTIVAMKHEADYLVDAGINLLNAAHWYPIGVWPARPGTGPSSDRTLYGCLCMNTDVLRQKVPLPNLNVGDQLVLHPVGAYQLSQSMQFITYRPKVLFVTESGAVEVIREKEDLGYVEALDRLPSRLMQHNPGLRSPSARFDLG